MDLPRRVHLPQARPLEREHDEVGHTVAVHVGQRVQHPAGALALRHVVHAPAADAHRCRERSDLVRVEGNRGCERRAGLRWEQTALVLQADLEVVPIPEHEIGPPVQVVVHLVDAATLLPGPVLVAVGAVDTIEPGRWSDRHRVGESPAGHLDEDPEAVAIHQHEVVAAVAVQVARDVHMEDFAPVGLVEVGRHPDHVALRRRLRIEPGQPVGAIGDQAVAAVDVRDVDERHIGAQRHLDRRRPVAVQEAEDAQPAVPIVVDAQGGNVGDPALQEKARQHGQALGGADNDLVPRRGERRRRRRARSRMPWPRHHASREADPQDQPGYPARSMAPAAAPAAGGARLLPRACSPESRPEAGGPGSGP